MKIQTIIPENRAAWLEARSMNINSTDVAALFGLSPYSTEFELYHRMVGGEILEFEENDRMRWGSRLQNAIAAGIAEDLNLKDWRAMPEYIFDPEKRMGSSFDFAIGREGLLEIKNVDSLQFREGWVDDDKGCEAPPHIELQVQHQLLVSGRKFAKIGVLIGGNKPFMIDRERDSNVISKIEAKVANFWEKVENKIEPKPDFAQDMEILMKIYGFSESGKIMDAKKDPSITIQALEYRSLGEQIKELEALRKEKKVRLLAAIGDSEKCMGDGFSISSKMIATSRVEAYDRAGYRDFRINFSKDKK